MKIKVKSKKIRILTAILLAAVFAVAMAMTFKLTNPTVAYADDSAFASETEIFYKGGTLYSTANETISYATKSVESYNINDSYPNYYNTDSALKNACAAVAGANIIGFYDRYFDDLIPNVTVGVMRGTEYNYHSMTRNLTQKQAVINTLFTYMQTNQSGDGATRSQFQSGLKKYINGKGLNITYNSVMTNGALDLNKVKTQLKSGNPIALYMSGYAFSLIDDSGKEVNIMKQIYNDNHIAVVFGYDKINYYNASGALIKTKTFLKVSNGKNISENLYIVSDYGKLNDADAAYVY